MTESNYKFRTLVAGFNNKHNKVKLTNDSKWECNCKKFKTTGAECAHIKEGRYRFKREQQL
jgi:hypothetical protein